MATLSGNNHQDSPATGRQKGLAVVIALGATAYLLLVTTGVIKQNNRLTTSELAIVVVAALIATVTLRPDILDRLQNLDFGGLKLQLGRLQEKQEDVETNQKQQAALLEDIRLALRLLIRKGDQEHLMNLFRHTTTNYRVKATLRDEIRRLRAMDLLRMVNKKTVTGMPEGVVFDLAEFVELTEDGKKLASRLADEGDDQIKGASVSS